jgi:hypothetical protein
LGEREDEQRDTRGGDERSGEVEAPPAFPTAVSGDQRE